MEIGEQIKADHVYCRPVRDVWARFSPCIDGADVHESELPSLLSEGAALRADEGKFE